MGRGNFWSRPRFGNCHPLVGWYHFWSFRWSGSLGSRKHRWARVVGDQDVSDV